MAFIPAEKHRPAPWARSVARGPDVGTRLVVLGHLSATELDTTRRRIARSRVRLSDALHILNGIDRGLIAAVEADLHRTQAIDPLADPPDAAVAAQVAPEVCLREGFLPWRRMGGCTVVLTARPETFARHRAELTRSLGPVRMAIARPDRLDPAIARTAEAGLARRAETRVRSRESCRDWPARRNALRAGGGLALLAAAALAAPLTVMGVLLTLTALLVLISTGLKLAAGWAALTAPPPGDSSAVVPAAPPVVSILVPLFKEREIAGHLLSRLLRLDYPPELLDICLVLEADDHLTKSALRRTTLPPWVRVIAVPHGTLKTKPRALNYALDFARGSIVGIYDAEDAPEPDQISKVVARFTARGPDVACLQGVLDYYNTSANWFTRCFTLEYANWFRLMLPGLARLGFVVPLGGTTLFFRRDALERLGGWDAHNVTEDADLGLRLARYGYRTELIETVTYEEANGRLWPWVRQRSRWLKGYTMTWAVHMRDPGTLRSELGALRFWGVQALFLGTVLQFALAPLLWACWWWLGGIGPGTGMVPPAAALTLALIFVASETVNLVLAALAARRAGRPWLALWAPTLLLYFPLATVAMYKALWETIARPFYWDKTTHGVFLPPVSPTVGWDRVTTHAAPATQTARAHRTPAE